MVDDFRRNFAHSINQDCTTSDEAFVTFRVSRFTPNDGSCDSAVAGDSSTGSTTNSTQISSTNSPGLVRRHRESPFAKKAQK